MNSYVHKKEQRIYPEDNAKVMEKLKTDQYLP